MDPPKTPHEHIKQVANHPAAVPVDSASPHLDFSRPNQSLPPASALSATRPVDLTTPPSRHGEPRTVLASPALRASASSPTESSQSTTPPPVLLSTLSASDGESILCIAVEAGEADAGSGTTANGKEGKDGDRSRVRTDGGEGRVYGGSQGGDIHVSLQCQNMREGKQCACRPFPRGVPDSTCRPCASLTPIFHRSGTSRRSRCGHV